MFVVNCEEKFEEAVPQGTGAGGRVYNTAWLTSSLCRGWNELILLAWF